MYLITYTESVYKCTSCSWSYSNGVCETADHYFMYMLSLCDKRQTSIVEDFPL
ncbi:hypothetical protein BC833DRAFT_605243 [Globomyces pollinis-pini]|nr:hypothetical protein BC833DRAFT_605243 [Globomyces pollinis-pini]